MVGAKSAVFGILLATGIGAQTYYWNPSPAGGGQIERTINWTSQADGGGTRPPSTRDDAFTTINTSVWSWIDSVPLAQGASTRSANGELTITAAGADVWVDFNQMAALYRTDITGAFDVSVKVVSQGNANAWSKCGIMAWDNFLNFSEGGGFAVEATPGSGFVVHYDSTDNVTEGTATAPGRFDWPTGPNTAHPVTYPHWLRLVKWVDSTGRWTFTGYYRTSETNAWTKIRGDYHPQNTADNSQVGLFVTSHNTTMASTVVFDDFRGGSNLTATNYNLSFNGTGSSADQNSILGAHVQAASIDFTGYSGVFSFGGWVLSISGDARFTSSMGGINTNTGRLTLLGNSGVQNLYVRPNDTLPSIHKSAAGEVVVQGAPLLADSLHIAQGIWDMGGQNHHLQMLTAAGGTLEGMPAADDTLFVYGRADFSGSFTFTPGLGTVAIKSVGTAKTVAFNPGGKTFNNLTLWTVPTGAPGVKIQVGPGNLVTSGNLVFRNQRAASTFNGETDFLAHNPTVTVGGSVSQIIEGTGTNWHPIRMGNGTWNVAGGVAFSLNGGSADNSVLNLTRTTGTQTLAVIGGALKTVNHAAAGTVRQTAPLEAGSLSLTGGTWDANGQDMTLSGNLTVNGPAGTLANLGGSDLVILGTASFTGTPGSRLNLAPASDWTVDVTGSFTADHVDVANSTALRSTGMAGANSADQGRNINWSFGGGPPTSIPIIGTEPEDATAMEGTPASFTVASTGHGPLAYEWRKVGELPVVGTGATLAFPSASMSQDGSEYRCIVSNSSGKDTTRAAKLTVTPKPVPASITQEPLDAVKTTGETATFTVAASGDSPLAYAWRKKGDTAVLATTATLTLAGLTLTQDDTWYQCIVSNAVGSDTSREARLDVNPPPVAALITREPRDTTVFVTQKASFSVGALGSTPLAFAWRRIGDTTVLSTDSVLAFATTVLAQDSGTYQCIVSNGYGADTSRGALLRVLPPPVAPKIVREPSDTLVKVGTRAAFSAGVLGSAPMRYEWRRKGDTALLSTDSLFVIASASEAMSGYSYYVIVSNNTPDKDTSAEARLTVRACDSLSIQTAGDTAVEEGKNVAVWGKAVCADRFEWSVVSGPAPRLLDPGVDTLAFRAPRVQGDTAILYRFTAFFGDVTQARDVRVGLKEAIPDPDMALPADLKWPGDKPLVLRPTVYNQAQLDLFTGYPLRYAWSLDPLAADTVAAGDSLTLRNPLGEGVLSAVLCMDNGGAPDCDTVKVTVQPIPTALASAGVALPGGLRLLGARLAWTAPGTVRIWDWRGRLLFQARGLPGSARDIPPEALRALLGRRARLIFRP